MIWLDPDPYLGKKNRFRFWIRNHDSPAKRIGSASVVFIYVFGSKYPLAFLDIQYLLISNNKSVKKEYFKYFYFFHHIFSSESLKKRKISIIFHQIELGFLSLLNPYMDPYFSRVFGSGQSQPGSETCMPGLYPGHQQF